MIRKSFDPVVVTVHPSSVLVEKDYRLKRDSDMNCYYVEVGERNVQEYVNSFEPGCSLRAILDRCSLMPAKDKISYLQQTTGASVDFSGLPSDLTEAFITLNRLSMEHPDLMQRFNNGESISSIISSIIAPAAAPAVAPAAAPAVTPAVAPGAAPAAAPAVAPGAAPAAAPSINS